MKSSSPDKLRRFYKQFSGADQVLVMINADPDAIASAMAVRRLLWRKAAGVAISNINVIKRPDNAAMVRLMRLKLIHADDVDAGRYNRFVIVDSQPNHNEAFSKIEADVIIDHHPDTGAKAKFTDIRPHYGATASILTEYLRAAKIKPSNKLATALFHAIKTDTCNFERQTLMEDLRAFQFLFKHANIHLARKIEQADLRLDFLKYFKIAIDNMRMHRGRMFVHLGPVINPDVCVLVADFLMRINAVAWSVVSGIHDNALIIVFRNDGIRKNAGQVAKKGFGHMGSAGGHKSAARAEIPLESLCKSPDVEDDKAMLKWIIDRIETRSKKSAVGFKKSKLGLDP